MRIINGKQIPSGSDVFDELNIDYASDLEDNREYHVLRNKWFYLFFTGPANIRVDFYDKANNIINGMNAIAQKYYFSQGYDLGFEAGRKYAEENNDK